MAGIAIRNLDDDIKRRLRVRAAKNGRSMEDAVQDGAMVHFMAVGEAVLRHGVAILPQGRRRAVPAEAISGMLEEGF